MATPYCRSARYPKSDTPVGKIAVFFTSDTHFGDHGVLNIRPRPFGSVTEMNEVIITRWNSRVGPGDEIWHLGDFARRLKVAEAILPRLNGRKHLVTGNNDEPAVCALNWSSVQAYTELIVDRCDACAKSVTIPSEPGIESIVARLTCMDTATGA